MKPVSFALASALLLASCSGNSGKRHDSAPAADTPDISHVWNIEAIVVNDSLSVRPSETTPGQDQYFTFFADGSFGINTNCNTLGGMYTLTGDSIAFTNMLTTEMACDNMEVEQLLMRVLPEVNTVDCMNDSTMRLNTSAPSAYIVLKKAADKVQSN